MKKYYLLLGSIFFTACMDSAKPVALEKEYQPYGAIQTACLKIINNETPHCEEEHCQILPRECSEFIEVLDGANRALVEMKVNKNNARYYVSKEKYKKEKKRLKIKHKHLNLLIKNQALDAMEADDVDEFEKMITFAYHPMNISYYSYMQHYLPRFEGLKKYQRFEKKFALKEYDKGYMLANRGRFTQALTHLERASKMKNIEASRLCGDIYSFLYPQKADECYKRGVELGNDHMKLLLAQAYESQEQMSKAKKWYEASANSGNFIAQYKLYDLDKQFHKDWLIKAADRGYDVAQYHYGLLLLNTKEYDRAQHYLQAAADQEYALAYDPLGKLYFAQKAYKKAYQYLSKAAQSADGAYKLAYMKEYGKGTSKNYYAASRYYTKAKQLGMKRAQSDIDRMKRAKRRLKKAQIKRQKASAEASYAQINAKARLAELVALEDQRIKAQWQQRSEEAKALKLVACGHEPNDSVLKSAGSRVHLQGRLSHWLGKTAFIVQAGGKEYYVMDEDDKARLNKGDSVNMVAVSTGRREITQGLRRSLFEEADETAIRKAYALTYEGVCPY